MVQRVTEKVYGKSQICKKKKTKMRTIHLKIVGILMEKNQIFKMVITGKIFSKNLGVPHKVVLFWEILKNAVLFTSKNFCKF